MQITDILNEIGVTNTVIVNTFKRAPNIFTKIGHSNPIATNIDCLENIPEFFTENANSLIIAINNNI